MNKETIALNYYNQQQFDKAKESFEDILSSNPSNATALLYIGLIHFIKRNYKDSYNFLKSALKLSDNIKIKINLGTVLHKLGRYSKAISMYEDVLKIEPQNIGILNNLCAIKLLYGKLSEAKTIAEKVIEIDPNYIDPYINLGNISKDMGDIPKAIEYYKKALTIDPHNSTAISNMLLAFHYIPYDNNFIFNQHLLWEKQIKPLNVEHSDHTLSLDRKINIGYLSGDFKKHSVSYFIHPILANHNLTNFNIYCYSDVINPDPVTIKFKNYPVNWRDIHKLYDEDVFKLIQNDQIDILVDLAGHAGNKRLKVFSKGAAPIQITYCGYPDTSGLTKMNYRITDNIADPNGNDCFYTEELIRFSNCFLCYRPSNDAPEVNETPAIRNGYITFGSFNHLSKLSDETIELWSTILSKLPDSKLLLKAKQFSDELIKDKVIEKFKKFKIKEEKVQLISHVSNHNEHLACYNKIDLALDPFPYNGTTTTCEALWMGVPVITLLGNNHAGRVGASLLTNIGLKSFIASDKNRYIEIIDFLTKDLSTLNKLRLGIRNALVASPICDAKKFTAELEKYYKAFIQKEILT